MSFTLRQLTQFLAVAEEEHFGRAAARLGMEQPPLSQAIAKMEREIGAPLFHRGPKGVRLTDAGKVLLPGAQDILPLADGMERQTREAARGSRGSLAIGFVSQALFGSLPPALRRFREDYPEASVTLEEMSTEDQTAALDAGHLDVGFLHPPVSGRRLSIFPLGEQDFIAAVPSGHRLASAREIDLSDLLGTPLVLFPRRQGPWIYGEIERAASECGRTLTVAAHAARLVTQLSLVASEIGNAIVARAAENLSMRNVLYRPIRGLPNTLRLPLALAIGPSGSRPLVQQFVAQVSRMPG